MRTVQRAALYLLALALLWAPVANAGSVSPFLLLPEEQADAAYQRYRVLCEEHGFDLLPDEEAIPEYADDGSGMVIVMRLPVDVAEWGLIYPDFMSAFLGHGSIGYSLCVHKDTVAFDRVDELMTMNLIALFDMRPETAQARVGEVLDAMESNEKLGSLGYIIMDGVRMIIAEDDIRRAQMLVEEPNY